MYFYRLVATARGGFDKWAAAVDESRAVVMIMVMMWMMMMLMIWRRQHHTTGLQLNKDQDVHIVMDNRGRASGEAFVRFGNLDDTEKALKRNREKIGHRWVNDLHLVLVLLLLLQSQ